MSLDLSEAEMLQAVCTHKKNPVSSILKNNFQLVAKGTDEVCMHVHIQFPFVASLEKHWNTQVSLCWGLITEVQIYVATSERDQLSK